MKAEHRAPSRARTSRAPRREGARTTLRVPTDLAATVRAYAEELDTSANDALLRLAERGAEIVERERRVEQLATERRAAMAVAIGPEEEDEPLHPEVVREAILGARADW